MQETELRNSLVAMRRKLVKDRDSINQQIRACDTVLAALPAPPPTVSAAPAEDTAALPEPNPEPVPPARLPAPAPAAVQPAGSLVGSVGPAPAPAVKPAMLNPQAREELILRANSRKRGAMEARVELAVAECGDTFSYHGVLARYEATHGRAGDWLAESVGSSLWKLARKRGYRIVQAGTGTLPTIYGK